MLCQVFYLKAVNSQHSLSKQIVRNGVNLGVTKKLVCPCCEEAVSNLVGHSAYFVVHLSNQTPTRKEFILVRQIAALHSFSDRSCQGSFSMPV